MGAFWKRRGFPQVREGASPVNEKNFFQDGKRYGIHLDCERHKDTGRVVVVVVVVVETWTPTFPFGHIWRCKPRLLLMKRRSPVAWFTFNETHGNRWKHAIWCLESKRFFPQPFHQASIEFRLMGVSGVVTWKSEAGFPAMGYRGMIHKLRSFFSVTMPVLLGNSIQSIQRNTVKKHRIRRLMSYTPEIQDSPWK